MSARAWVWPGAIGAALLALSVAVSWPVPFALAIGAAGATITAASRQLGGVDAETANAFASVASTGLRSTVATTAGAFRAARLTGTVEERLAAAVRDYVARAGLSEGDAVAAFGPVYPDLIAGRAHPTPAQSRAILPVIAPKGHVT